LSFEHVPPREAYNDFPVVRQSLDEAFAGYAPIEQRRGRGEYALCTKCNSETGGWYGGAFVEFVKQALEQRHYQNGKPSMIYMGEIEPLRVGKQILTMFLATCGPGFREKNSELANLVLDANARVLPPRYKLYAFWMGKGFARQSGVASQMHLATNRSSTVAEVVHWPFGYLLEFSGHRFDQRPVDISDFLSFELNDRRSINRRLPVLPTLWSMPGDYRDQDAIDRDVLRNFFEEIHAEDAEGAANAALARYGPSFARLLTLREPW
jgi:hypothetical protein